MNPRRYVKPEEPKAVVRAETLHERIMPVLDLTPIARPGAVTTIDVHDYSGRRSWIKLHDISLTQSDRGNRRGSWQLGAYWGDNVTDGEHDSAYILRLELSGVELDMVHYGITTITGVITGDVSDFHVPPPGYDALIDEHPETIICKECRKRDKTQLHHVMVPEGYYVPPEQPELYAQMVGRRVEITITRPSDEED